MIDEQSTDSWVEHQREEMDYISPKMLSYSQRCDLINNTIILCELYQHQQTQLSAMRGALVDAVGALMYAFNGLEPHEVARRAVLWERIDAIKRMSLTASPDDEKRIKALERVSDAAQRFVDCIGEFHVTRDQLVGSLAELETRNK